MPADNEQDGDAGNDDAENNDPVQDHEDRAKRRTGDDPLPEKVKDELDEEQQDVYRDAYHTALEDGGTQEAAHDAAKEAVSRNYDKAMDAFDKTKR